MARGCLAGGWRARRVPAEFGGRARLKNASSDGWQEYGREAFHTGGRESDREVGQLEGRWLGHRLAFVRCGSARGSWCGCTSGGGGGGRRRCARSRTCHSGGRRLHPHGDRGREHCGVHDVGVDRVWWRCCGRWHGGRAPGRLVHSSTGSQLFTNIRLSSPSGQRALAWRAGRLPLRVPPSGAQHIMSAVPHKMCHPSNRSSEFKSRASCLTVLAVDNDRFPNSSQVVPPHPLLAEPAATPRTHAFGLG